jgi:hypothetical protein
MYSVFITLQVLVHHIACGYQLECFGAPCLFEELKKNDEARKAANIFSPASISIDLFPP